MINDDFDLGEDDDIPMMLIMDEMHAEDKYLDSHGFCLTAVLIIIAIPTIVVAALIGIVI